MRQSALSREIRDIWSPYHKTVPATGFHFSLMSRSNSFVKPEPGLRKSRPIRNQHIPSKVTSTCKQMSFTHKQTHRPWNVQHPEVNTGPLGALDPGKLIIPVRDISARRAKAVRRVTINNGSHLLKWHNASTVTMCPMTITCPGNDRKWGENSWLESLQRIWVRGDWSCGTGAGFGRMKSDQIRIWQ